ncbi:hypothetical protein R1sor_027435 [Riccia sorocarpa]|uniref:Uncharacterized protein n=1 Tax=Riccia sorocarpa TaxID=122646 RepID=A0ABD3GFX5_9MARC
MGREDVAYVDAGGPAFFLNRSVSPASSCNSSSSESEMKPRAMARSLGAHKNAARHRMTKQDYEMIVTYLEDPDNFVAINRCGRKTKITGKTLTKVTAFGHMAVTLCAQGFVKCSGVIMGKKVARYVCTYKNARTFYLGIGSGLTEAEIAVGLTLEQKMNAKCHYFFRMHTLFGARANVEPHALGDAGLPAEMIFDDRDLCQDSQAAFQFSAVEPMLSGDEEEAADREEEPIDLPPALLRTVVLKWETRLAAQRWMLRPTRSEHHNRTGARSKAEAHASVQSIDDVRSSGKTVRSRDRPPPPERKTSLITAYEEQEKEKLILRKEAQDQKGNFRDVILEDRRQAREQREREREREPEFRKGSKLYAGLEQTAVVRYWQKW